MAERRALVNIDGVTQELPTGDTLYGASGGGSGLNVFFGPGMDGDVTISANTTLTRTMYYNNLTINSSAILTTAGYRIFCKGTLTTASSSGIAWDGTAGNNASGSTGASAATVLVGAELHGGGAGQVGRNGGATTGTNGQTGSANNAFIWQGRGGANSGAGGAGTSGAGGTAGTSNTLTTIYGINYTFSAIISTTYTSGSAFTWVNAANSAVGGAGGGGNVTNAGGGGGSGGAAGGLVEIWAKIIVNNGFIRARGGAGGNGAAGTASNCGGGGGGAGGGGGGVRIMTTSFTGNNPDCSGGAGGNGGASGGGSGIAGGNGNAGSAGQYFIYNLSTGDITYA